MAILGKHGWNVMKLDEDNCPHSSKMVNNLHYQNMRLMLSLWSRIENQSEIGKVFEENNFCINPEASQFNRENFSVKLLPYHIDGW